MLVTPQDIEQRLPNPISPADRDKLGVLIEDAEGEIVAEFQRAGRDFRQELKTVTWLEFKVKKVIREMVSAFISVGGNAGVRTLSSTTGPQSDTVTYATVDVSGYGGVTLTDAWRAELGLLSRGPSGEFPPPLPWPERTLFGGWCRGESRDHWS